MNCKDVEKNISAYIDNELHESLAFEIRSHINQCDSCARMFRQYVLLQRDITTIENNKEPEMSLEDAMREMQRLKISGLSSSASTRGILAPAACSVPISSRHGLKIGMAVAATLVAGVVLFVVSRPSNQPARQLAQNTTVNQGVSVSNESGKDSEKLNDLASSSQKISDGSNSTIMVDPQQPEEDATPAITDVAKETIFSEQDTTTVASIDKQPEVPDPTQEPQQLDPEPELLVQQPDNQQTTNIAVNTPEPEATPQQPEEPSIHVLVCTDPTVPDPQKGERIVFLREDFIAATVASIGNMLPVAYKQVKNEYGDPQSIHANKIPTKDGQLELTSHISAFKQQIIDILTQPGCDAVSVRDYISARPPALVVTVPAENIDNCLRELKEVGAVGNVPIIPRNSLDNNTENDGFVRLRIIYDISKDIQ